ncbi:BamA/TamA family outer membrane protein [Mucilaginibacter lutimaris]|uniref:BamA/TamA family outer membrane protein n=1 Tax=Mucilaginibacter lutimaris TaxID=931629 RepID=A0ABW2ZEG5_9SPHI
MRKIILFLASAGITHAATAQVSRHDIAGAADSVTVNLHSSYDQVSKIHRRLFGENYRKDWALPVKLPVIRLSGMHGGLTPVKEGGGMESKSLRLRDAGGREWVLRSVEKVPDKLLPENLRGTFAVDWVGDEFTGQHPYSALVVPPLAEAAGVPHANPVIGVVADDPALGDFRTKFTGMVCLLEEREPAGSSESTLKMERDLMKNYANRFDGKAFLKARMLDLLLGDWDRHEDQWRWTFIKNGNERLYKAVPRDRDQVFHVTEGLFPSIASLPWLDPTLEDFEGKIPRVKWSVYKTRFIKAYPDAQISYEDWMQCARDLVAAENDSVLLAGLKRLPKEIYDLRGAMLFGKLKQRRNNIPAAMSEYYYFINRIVDIRTSDKNELITITGTPDKSLRINIKKINGKQGPAADYMDMVYPPQITKEIRLYTGGGNDRIIIDNQTSPIRLRVIDSADAKYFYVKNSVSKIRVYGAADSTRFEGNPSRLIKYLSNDTANLRMQATNLYNKWMPLGNAAINADDGFLIGAGFKYTAYDGFRKGAYSQTQQFMLTHSFATDAFRINYDAEWIKAIGNADLTLHALVQAPDNTMNFFGRGNETRLVKFEGYRRYHRAIFDTYDFDPALRWRTGKGSSVSFGPSFQLYHLNPDENIGRLINLPSLIHAYDSAVVDKDKAHVGLVARFISNRRNNDVFPSKGYYFDLSISGYKGLNDYSRSFAQIRTEFTWYLKPGSSSRLVFSDRIGGGISIGSPAFYQSMFLGGQGNLLGFLKNRFAGQHMVFNNLQARLKLADIAGYILPGQFGMSGFYDAGRVWVASEHSDKIHQGVGGGLYFAPASLTVLQVLAGHSEEGWYPYIAFNFRF